MGTRASQSVTQILAIASDRDPSAADQLLPLVYGELRRLARHRMAHEPPGHTLQATALVHEAYVRLVGDADVRWGSRAHFFAAAALAMRRILVEHARKRARPKHGGGKKRVQLEEAVIGAASESLDMLALDEALSHLQARDRRKSDVVMLRFFAGLTIAETAQALRISTATVKSEWSYAKAWLHRELCRGQEKDGGPHAEKGQPL